MRVVALLLLATACEREWVREYHGSVLSRARGNAAVFLVRDYLTGTPIEGAVIRQHEEWSVGPDGRWAPSVAEAFTDEFGLVTFPLEEDLPDSHWAVHASGYAPTEEYGTGIAREVDLRPGRRYAGRVLDIDGAPLVGALVEWKVGCAHAPSFASTRTDETGLFVLDGIDDGEFVLEGPPGAADYVDAASPPRPVALAQVLPGRTIEGRVRCTDGTAPQWAVVLGSTRAPRAVADRDGRFALRGVRHGSLQVWWDRGSEELQDDLAPGLPATWTVGAPFAEPRRVRVRVRIRDERGAPPPVDLAVHFDSLADGRRHSFEWSPWEQDMGASVPLGTYRLSAGDAWSAFASDPMVLRVRPKQQITLVVRGQPTLAFDAQGLPAEAKSWIILESESWEIDGDDEPAHLPPAARAWLRVDLGRTPYTFAIGPERDGVRRADVRLPGRKFVQVRGLEDGLKAELLGEETEIVEGPEPLDVQTGSNGLVTYAVGERALALSHPHRGWALVKVDLPFEGATLKPDCTLTPWPTPLELRVLLDDGAPVAGATVTILDEDNPEGQPFLDEPSETDRGGVLRSRRLRDGVHVRIDRAGCVPAWSKLSGTPPYEIRLGRAVIEVDVTGLESAGCVLDGFACEPETDSIVVRGLAAGPHTLIVGAAGRRSVAYGIVLRQGEARRLKPTLR